jgi:hypothetical protein
MLVIPSLLLRTIAASDIVAQLVADNDKETRAETTVTGTTESPSVINSRRPKGSTMAQSRDLKQQIRLAIADSAEQKKNSRSILRAAAVLMTRRTRPTRYDTTL